MGWDTERTRARLLEAAIDEFSMRGFSGASIERIATAAGINRERVYAYFGSKRGLFEAALTDRLVFLIERVPVTGSGAAAAGAFAAAYFRVCERDPRLARLVQWEGLELTEPVDPTGRRARSRRKAAELAAACGRPGGEEADDLLWTIVALVNASFASMNLAKVITDPNIDARRASITRTAEVVAASSPVEPRHTN
ncbi:MAG: TetR/AcrR family transcriptional regulator [Microbacterium sp.]|jgi:AcrR family transcriptional regulator|nr:TetR/AcrR family transcriptional regulator [Microbacterium sp.]